MFIGRSPAYVYHLGVDQSPARVALAKEARDAALRLGPDRAEPHLAAAEVAFHCDLDYETALAEVAIAQRGLPNDASVFSLPAYVTRRQGHWERCTRNLERAVELDPRNVWLLNDTAWTYQFFRRFPEATAAWDRVLTVAPGDPAMRVSRALVDLDHARHAIRHEIIQRIVTEDPRGGRDCRAMALSRLPARCRGTASALLLPPKECSPRPANARFFFGVSRTLETMPLARRQHLPRTY